MPKLITATLDRYYTVDRGPDGKMLVNRRTVGSTEPPVVLISGMDSERDAVLLFLGATLARLDD